VLEGLLIGTSGAWVFLCTGAWWSKPTEPTHLVFHASSAAWTFWRAVSSVKGGSGGRTGDEGEELLLAARAAIKVRCDGGAA